MDVTLLDYELPEELVAQRPHEERDGARLLVLDVEGPEAGEGSVSGAVNGTTHARTSERESGAKRDAGELPYGRVPRLESGSRPAARVAHRAVRELPDLVRPALWVVNDTRVLASRLFGRKSTGGRVEIFLLERESGPGKQERWRALGRASKPLREGDVLAIEGASLRVTLASARGEDGTMSVVLEADEPIAGVLERVGHVPLPPYIRRPDEPDDRARYQTVFASNPGAVAAPTAGLHFTDALIGALETAGHRFARVTLHVGAGTFRPVKSEQLEDHPMHSERYEISPEAAAAIDRARAEGTPVIAVGTTVVRTLESAAIEGGRVRAGAASTNLFIRPPHRFRVIDGLLTNFHQPRSTLLALVMSLAGVDAIRDAYAEAVAARYRFFSYGDAMLIRGPSSIPRSRPRAEMTPAFGRHGIPARGVAPPSDACVSSVVAPRERGASAPSVRRSPSCSGPVVTLPTEGFAFSELARDGDARRGRFTTPHAVVETPVFMPVGTAATVKGMRPEEVEATGARLILANTYHLWLRPGPEQMDAFGGVRRFMGWPHALLTDSGGFQVFSLAQLNAVDDEGVTFRSHLDGRPMRLTPEESMRVQACLGADVAMAFDECPPGGAERKIVERAVRRTSAWARRSLAAPKREGQARFGIVQGATHVDLRLGHLDEIAAMPFDGIAMGGFSVGEPIPEMHRVLGEVAPKMPADRPRYLMGVGTPFDLLAAVGSGIDLFDCVLPTRNARNGQALTWQGRVNLKQARHKTDESALDPRCECPTCATFSRAYLSHLMRCEELLGPRLLTQHNLWFYGALMRHARAAIEEGRYARWAAETAARMREGDEVGAPDPNAGAWRPSRGRKGGT